MEDPTLELITTLYRQAEDASYKITELETEYILEEKRVGVQRDHVDNLKTGIAQAVANAREDVTGKPKFSNDLARKAEVEDRLSVHSVYREALQKLEDATLAQQLRRVKVDQAHRDHQLARLSYEAIAIGRRQ